MRWKIHRASGVWWRLTVWLVAALGPVCPALAHGTLDEQIAEVDRRIAKQPDASWLYLQRGDLYRRHRDWVRSFADFEHAAKLNVGNIEVHYLRGKTYLDMHRPRDARSELELFLRRLPDRIESRGRRGSALLLLGKAMRRLGQPRDAAELFTRALEALDRPAPQAFLECARAFEAAGEKHLGAAMSCLEKGIERLGAVVSLEQTASALRRRQVGGEGPREEAAPPGGPADQGTPPVAGGFATDLRSGSVKITRGPYLQQATPSSLVVRWRTDVAVDSRVSWGDAPSNLTELIDELTPVTDHEVAVTGLVPATTYFYAVGTTTMVLAGADPATRFTTPPPVGTAPPTRLWVIGDSGAANANAAAVRDAYLAFADGRIADLWLMLGDNAYPEGTDAEYQAALFDIYPSILRQTVLWPTLGNHDGISADSSTQSGPYYDIFTLPTAAEAGGVASGTEAYYSFDYGNLHFIVLDSHESDRSPGGAMMTWLAADAAASTADWTIAYWHHPPYSKGSHDSDTEGQLIEMRQIALPILEDAGVDLVLAGHSHAYERSFLLDHHYGNSSSLTGANVLDPGDGRPVGDGAYRKLTRGSAPHEGTVYTVAGSSSRVGGGTLDHPAMFLSLSRLGSMVLDVDGLTLDALFLDDQGVVADAFSLVKGCLLDIECDDGRFCNGAEICDPFSNCQPGFDPCAPLNCDRCGVCGGDDSSCGVFFDGLESGNTGAWSFAVP